MTPVTRHIILPIILPILFFAIAFTPVEVLGCRTRGLLALSVSLASGLAAVWAAARSAKGRMRGEKAAYWWMASSLILAIPVVAMIILA